MEPPYSFGPFVFDPASGELRREGVVELQRGRVTVLDERKLLELADFDGRYLHQSPML